jgi:hypothetical protein
MDHIDICPDLKTSNAEEELGLQIGDTVVQSMPLGMFDVNHAEECADVWMQPFGLGIFGSCIQVRLGVPLS